MKITLWQIVRASAAAPFVFEPEVITLKSGKKYVFFDGGVTPHNNPGWLLCRMATEEAYNLNWETGEDKLLLISVGTGSSPKGDNGEIRTGLLDRLRDTARTLVGSLSQGTMVDQDTNCRQIGRCVHG